MEGQGVEGVSCPHSEGTRSASLSDSTMCCDTEQKSLPCTVMFIFLMQVTEGSRVATAFIQELNMVKIQTFSRILKETANASLHVQISALH